MTSSPGPVLLQVTNLSVSYHHSCVLDGLCVPIRRGAITAIVGPSGCGKSTFLSCLNRLSDLSAGCRVSGSIRLDGVEITGPQADLMGLRRRVGWIAQRPNPFPFSIRRNLSVPLAHHGLHDRRRRNAVIESVLQEVGLWPEVRSRLDDSALKLSGGQQQRLCLARALALQPELLLLDEPCSALDPLASGVVEDLIAGLRGRCTQVIVTHNLAQARRLADDLIVFWTAEGRGTIVEQGPAEQLFSAPAHPITAAYLRGERG
ncbi:ATP-binding cassette domain-containing protein [Cyanobium sp. LEGE 06143]|jgi:phosphate transport system ATP-binding protein|uniref:phosphate ABC transporter ATP-binding protein n=1 Tax=Cyanobium sp. LEGE 06143 TaxID=945727 RepID=UPI001880B96C|nr:ATP-binding cassette domain-containing protein [Cyanobium sp. LEGE 06143]MBE9173412.1 ATP-binding cassette domain-containing protein [Cyanobium sp. LEGE 06143]